MEPLRIGVKEVFINKGHAEYMEKDPKEIEVSDRMEDLTTKVFHSRYSPEAIEDMLEGNIVKVEINDSPMKTVKEMIKVARKKGYKKSSIGPFLEDGTRFLWLRKK